MELPQPRAFGTEGGKTTHDFLSLYSSLEQDSRPPQGGFLRTHDFLQPLEGAGKSVGKEEIDDEVEMRDVEKPLPPAHPAVEHVLPGGIGTYSISYLHQRSPKPNDENSDYSSCTRNESTLKKGMAKKDNFAGDFRAVLRETGMNKGGGSQLGQPSQTPSNLKNKTATFSSFLASQQFSEQNNQSFLDMIASSKSVREDDGDLEEEEEFVIKKEQSLHPKGNLSAKVDEKSSDQKPNTPRSKHSATEQRRRSKINDRFQMLRGIIPHSDQKRDKASFLLEVIEYIKFLQEKVHKYEGSYQGCRDNETSKLPWSKCHSDAQGYIDHSQGKNNVSGPALMFGAKFGGTRPWISLPIPISEQNIESNMKLACPKENDHQIENNEKPVSLPMLPNAFPFCGTSNIVAQHSPKLALGRDASTTSRHQSQCSSDKSKDEDLTVESGTISISSMYSQGLLNTLTKALENSGVDLSQASISVHVDLGKRSNGRLNNSSASTLKGDDVSTSNQPMPHSITSTSQGECGQAQKRLKTSRG
ncbi:PREDICTED: transcription factor BIM2-like isoform X2 [Ipomoea nil]|uniref:transcription factor BIM2-like isoform X2 n=1 Tax=Ipomoea nil TaxID=35883 RepID=UPI000900AB1B|nr:PREDICTED: transcription factor BIM2-like isoform X2 [Ipomoea nil]